MEDYDAESGRRGVALPVGGEQMAVVGSGGDGEAGGGEEE